MLVFLAVSENLANHLVQAGLVSRQELSNYLFDSYCWLGWPSVLQWRKCSPSCMSPQYCSLQKNVMLLLYLIFIISISLSYMLQDLENDWWFPWKFGHLVSLGQSSSVWSHTCTCRTPSAAISFGSIFMISKDTPDFGNYWFIKCQNVNVHLYFFTTFSFFSLWLLTFLGQYLFPLI